MFGAVPKSRGGIPCVATDMNAFQIEAGHVPPNTVEIRTLPQHIGICPCGNPTHTAVTSCGTAPTNHASLAFCAVPVLPNCGRPMLAPTPVPDRTTPLRMSTASAAIAGCTSCWARTPAWYSTRPSRVVTEITGVGCTCLPRYASVPYADAISSVLTSFTPSTAAGTAARGPFGSLVRGQQRIPMRVAASTRSAAPAYGSPAPMIESRLAYATLTELMVALSSEIVPYPPPSAFCGSQYVPFCSRMWALDPFSGWVRVIPCSSAATRANGLNAEPAWRPVLPPVARLMRAKRSSRFQ